ncbi:MAG: hypothetical protein GXX85_17425 [Ignavibacteria bacterium]|nr:hypothetical protein [Ignavibacteria bacterium]
MTDISKKAYRELSLPHFREVFRIIDTVCGEMGIGYYLIGAQAKDFHFLEKGFKPRRDTKDIDFAVMMPEMKVYDNMINRFIQSGFKKAGEPYRIIHVETDTIIDLLPFGELEAEGTVKFTEREIELSVVGMKEVKSHTVAADLEEITIKVSPLEGLVILKLISFSDKPQERTKDLDDINEILKNYFDINSERFFEDHLDLVDEIPTDNYTELAGARLLGRDMKLILAQSQKLSNTIKTILSEELKDKPGSISEYFLRKNYAVDYELLQKVFGQILKGIEE